MPSERDVLLTQLKVRLSKLIDTDSIAAVTDADLSSLRKPQLKQLCAHFRLDFGGNKNNMKDRLRVFCDGKPATPPPEERKQPALPLLPMSPLTYAAAAAPAIGPGESLSTTPRSIAAVNAVDDLEAEARLEVENAFIEGEPTDHPDTAATTTIGEGLSSRRVQHILTSPTAVATQVKRAV